MSKLNCKITQRRINGTTIFEGTMEVPGLTPTKLQKGRGTNTTTHYTSRSGVIQAARALALKLNYEDVNINDTTSTTTSASTGSSSRTSRTTSSTRTGLGSVALAGI